MFFSEILPSHLRRFRLTWIRIREETTRSTVTHGQKHCSKQSDDFEILMKEIFNEAFNNPSSILIRKDCIDLSRNLQQENVESSLEDVRGYTNQGNQIYAIQVSIMTCSHDVIAMNNCFMSSIEVHLPA